MLVSSDNRKLPDDVWIGWNYQISSGVPPNTSVKKNYENGEPFFNEVFGGTLENIWSRWYFIVSYPIFLLN